MDFDGLPYVSTGRTGMFVSNSNPLRNSPALSLPEAKSALQLDLRHNSSLPIPKSPAILFPWILLHKVQHPGLQMTPGFSRKAFLLCCCYSLTGFFTIQPVMQMTLKDSRLFWNTLYPESAAAYRSSKPYLTNNSKKRRSMLCSVTSITKAITRSATTKSLWDKATIRPRRRTSTCKETFCAPPNLNNSLLFLQNRVSL